MKSTFVRLTIGSGALALFTLTAGIAAAQPPASNALAAPAQDVGAPPTIPPGTYAANKTSPTADQGTKSAATGNKAKEDFHPLAIEAYPLAATIGRYSLGVEWMPARHHALLLNPHFDHVGWSESATINGVKSSYSEGFTGGGAELGYRFYTGDHGANGFYIGPSFLFADYSTSAGNASSSFTSIGGAIDIGGQALIARHVIVGGGFGLQYTKTSKDFGSTSGYPLSAAILAGGGIRPRFLLSVGYAP